MTDNNINTEENLDISENSNLLDNENNNEVDNIINNSLSEEENIENETTEKEEETEESDTSTNQEVDNDSDIPEEDEENSDIIDNVTDETKTTDNANTEEDEYFSSIEEMYNFNIDAISSVNLVKSDINRRLMIRKLKLAKENNGLKLMFKILFSFFILFYIKSCTNNLLSQTLLNSNLAEKGFIFKTTIFILKKLHIIVFLLFTNIGHIFFDILLLFFVEIIDVLVFILDRFDYDIITKEREIRKLKDNEENKDNDSNKDNSYMMIVINGVLYIFVNGILVPLSMLLKSINKSIAISGDWLSNLFLSKKDLLIKRQPNMDIKKSRLINSLEGKQPTKDKNIDKKRSLFDRFRAYLNRIVERNGLLTNSLRGEGKKPKMSKITSRTLGIKGGRNSSRGKGASRGRDGLERSLEGKERSSKEKETDTKGKDDISKREGKSDDNRGEVKEGNKQIGQETITKSGQRRDDNSRSNLHNSVDNQSRKETVVQQGNPVKSNNLNQGVGANNTTKTSDTVKEPPKPTKQAQNNFDPEKERKSLADRKEAHDLFTKGEINDFDNNGRCGGIPLEVAEKIAEKVKERNERQQLNKEEDKSKNPDDNKKQGQSEQVDTVISDSVGTVDGGKNKGDVAKDKIEQKFKKADKRTEVFNEQPQKKEQINESLKKLEERRKKSKQQENAPQNNSVAKGLKGVQELNNQDKPGVKNERREKFQGQTGNSKSQSISFNQIRR